MNLKRFALFAIAVIAILSISTISALITNAQTSDTYNHSGCYIETEDGEFVDLGTLCESQNSQQQSDSSNLLSIPDELRGTLSDEMLLTLTPYQLNQLTPEVAGDLNEALRNAAPISDEKYAELRLKVERENAELERMLEEQGYKFNLEDGITLFAAPR